MAADGGFYRASHAAEVCVTCKGRKKKCDKVLPRCGYCVRKRVGCGYGSRPRNHDHTRPVSFPLVSSHAIPSAPATSEANLYLQAHRLIRATGQFVDDISVRYFRGMHPYLPIISRMRFHSSLITLGTTPSAGFSVLLLSICLATSSPQLEWLTGHAANTQAIDRRSLHLATKSLLAQVQGSFPPSIHLIQAALLLAVYEYAQGRPDEAFVSIAGCARMAYAARIHRPSPVPPRSEKVSLTTDTDPDTDLDLQLQVEEAANTWWGIIICERIFFCEVTVCEQPLLTVIPCGDARLPTEPNILEQTNFLGPESLPYVPLSSLSSVDVGGFGRSAQAVWLLDQVLKGFEIPSLGSRLIQLRGLDSTLQAFLGVLMRQRNEKEGIFCEAIAITIRALFTLHWHILSQSLHVVSAKYQSLEEWCKCSHAALDTATKMTHDVVEAHEHLDIYQFACVAPSYLYIVKAALKHIHGRTEWKGDRWLQSAEARLCTALDRFNYHWNVNDDQTPKEHQFKEGDRSNTR
ncbi:hypothetical protein B7463_g4874, partial [Scytalidium lignicola]